MSYFMTGEKLKMIDILMIFITFAGVTLISMGFAKHKEAKLDKDETQ